jgi:2-hydroxychromene-2-carboxylate isomerase
MATSFAVTFDYRCPFARNAHEHIVAGLQAGADWDVRFLAFSLNQVHVKEGEPAVWEEPERYPGILVNLAGIVVRERHPDQFLAAHVALFAARHDQAVDLRDRSNLAKVLDDAGLDASAVLAEIDSGWPLKTLRDEHTEGAEKYDVFGVPTFIVGEQAVFVRLMDRPEGDAAKAKSTIERVIGLFEWPELNEFKHTSTSR